MTRALSGGRLLPLSTLAVALVLAVSGCGSDDDGGASSEPASSSGGSASEQPVMGSDEELAATIKTTYGTDVPTDDIDPVTLEALRVAAAPVTPELRKKLLECMSKPICETGRGTLTIGLAQPSEDDLGKISERSMFTLQALRYPQVKKIIYTNANADTATAISNFRSLISQKADVITGLFNAGAALLPVARQATEAGAQVVQYTQPIPGAEAGKDVLTFVGSDICGYGTTLGEAIAETKPSGEAALYTGVPGNPYGATWMPCAEKALEANGWKVALKGDTNWTVQGTQKAASALIASGKKVDAIAYDYTPQALINAYVSRGETPPAIFAGSGTAGYFKAVDDAKEKGVEFDAFIANSQVWLGAVSITAGIMAAEGGDVPPEVTVPNPIVPLDNLRPQYAPTQQEQQRYNIPMPPDLVEELGKTGE